MTRSFFAKIDKNMQGLLSGALSALLIKTFGALIVFIFNIFLARLLGASGAGVYFLALSITTISSVISRVGLDNTLLRYIAAESSEENWKEVKGITTKAISIVLPLSLGITCLVIFLAEPISIILFKKPELIEPLRWMSFSILPLSLLSLYAEMLKALKRIPASLSLQSIFLPLINLIVLIFLAEKYHTSAASISYLLATLSTAILGGFFWNQHAKMTRNIKGSFGWKRLMRSSLPNYGVALLHKAILPWLPILLLGFWTSNIDVGLFSASTRTALLVSFILLAVNSVIAPQLAISYKKNDLLALKKLTRDSTWLTTLIAFLVVLPILIFPEAIMNIFGDEFKKASSLLVILSIGQFINVIFGPVGYLLVMTGNESKQKNSVLISSIVLLVLLIALVPIYGSLGAAISTVISGVLFNLISYLYVKNILGFSPFFTFQRKLR